MCSPVSLCEHMVRGNAAVEQLEGHEHAKKVLFQP